ncbi:2-methylisocitrate lyase-like PEP mutase family enzyme [Stackebrandtia albiflava]|uniref:2-methylisocitrate lyase-like PEP mutase family enzyme n=1 Tax=Stackebrandtia albiflava TaxID=406432 RepID=A0A562VBJ6_9ACTN|nr:isocitrate lyase/phosphoenolpyruvate mutase family protein [Stackebrandtia albiflava]TWJ15230.1 2-methylisocitrate lyase-like PEP mutase family enzyme [Stackebrandtia albiflava]
MTDIHELATRFHRLHDGPHALRLANCWDAGSAAVIARAGADAVATTSAGVAWSLGVADGDRLDRAAAVDAVARITRSVSVPVTADIESGYGETPDDVAETVRLFLTAGVVGVNIEDAHEGGLRDVTAQAERIAAARQAAADAGVDLFVNARIDNFLGGIGEPEGRTAVALERAARYLAAGASGIFVPGVADLAVVRELADGIDAPLNVMAGGGAPPVPELETAGARRVSVGPGITLAAYALAGRAATELFETGGYTSLTDGLGFAEVNAMWSR